MKKYIAYILSIFFILNLTAIAYAKESVWDGSVDTSWFTGDLNKYSISTAAELAGLAKLVNGGNDFRNITVSLEADIVLNNGTVEKNDGKYSFVSDDTLNEWTPIGMYSGSSSRGFRGVFEGNNHKISGMYINSDDGYSGLFGISYGCTINSLKIDNSLVIVRKNSAGGILAGVPEAVGSAVSTYIDACSVNAVITDNGEGVDKVYLGGVVGSGKALVATRNIYYKITNTHFDGTVDLMSSGITSAAAGIIARGGVRDEIMVSYNSGDITGNENVAGICAAVQSNSVISECYNSGEITSNGYAGGITGSASVSSTVKNSFNVGKIAGAEGQNGGISASISSDEKYSNNYYLDTSADCAYVIDCAVENASGKAERASEADFPGRVLNALNGENDTFVIPLDGGYPVIREIYYQDLFAGKYEVNDPYVSGEAVLGTNLTAEFTATGEQTAIDCIKYQWFKSANAGGVATMIEGATEKSLTVTKDLNDSYIKFVLYLPTGEKMESPEFYLNVFDTSFTGTIKNLEIRGIFKAGNTLFYKYTSDDVDESEIFETQWFMASGENDTYEEVGTDSFYETEDTSSTIYYKVKVTLINGIEYTSSPIAVEGHEKKKHTAVDGETTKFDVVNKTTPTENVFTVGGQEFILLDTVPTSDSGRFLVLAKSSVSKYGTSSINDINADSLLEKLPQDISEYIEKTTYWHSGVNAWDEYRNYGKYSVYIPSLEEVKKYSDKIGLADETSNWWTRSNATLTSDGSLTFVIDTENIGKTDTLHISSSAAVRPIFYLGVDFFKNVKLDTGKIGKNVFAAIRDNYDKAELLSIYSAKELEEGFGYETDIIITAGTIDGILSDADFNVQASIKSNIDGADIKVVAALYDDEGSLVDLVYNTMLLNKGDIGNTTLPFADTGSGNKTVKITILGGDTGFMPLSSQMAISE